MTFKELYEEKKRQPRAEAPATAFVKEIAAVTRKTELTVRRWLCDGESACSPDPLAQEAIARHLRCTPEELFPKS